MAQLIFLVTGITALFLKKLNVTAGISEIRRPRTYYLGILLILCAVVWPTVDGMFKSKNGDYTIMSFVADLVVILIPLIAIVFLKQPKVDSSLSK